MGLGACSRVMGLDPYAYPRAMGLSDAAPWPSSTNPRAMGLYACPHTGATGLGHATPPPSYPCTDASTV